MRVDFCASGVILHPDDDKVLLIFHRKLQKRLQVGGHVDPGELPHETVLREVQEETGLECSFDERWHVPFVDNEGSTPLPIAQFRQLMPAYGDDPEHIHFDSRYVLRALSTDVCLDDAGVEDARWFSLEEIQGLSDHTFPSVIQVVEKLLG